MPENLRNSVLVSIVIPVYNGEKYIGKTIDSVLSQTHSLIEIFIVNDGSTDTTAKIISEYALKNSSIKIENIKNSGVSSARNLGLNKSNGNFIAFLDADDIWQENHLETQLENIYHNTSAFGVSSYCEIIDENGFPSGEFKKGDSMVSLKDIMLWKGNYITIPSGILFKTELIKEWGGFNINLSNNADQELIMRGLHARYTFHTLDKCTWYYRKHQSNMSSGLSLMEKDTKQCYSIAEKNGYFSSFLFKRRCMSRMSLIIALSWWKNGKNKARSLVWICNSFLYSPINFVDQIFEKIFLFKKLKSWRA